MDLGIGLLVILYIVGSAIAAVMKKVMSGPIMEDPRPRESVPDPSVQSAEELGLAEDQSDDRDEHSRVLDHQSQVLEGEGRTAESPERVLASPTWAPGKQDRTLEGAGRISGNQSNRFGPTDLGPYQKGQAVETQEKQSVIFPTTLEGWQRALILAEILAPPVSKR